MSDDPEFHARYHRMYRFMTGATTSMRLNVATLAAIWHDSGPVARKAMEDELGADRIWCILELHKNGVREKHGSGHPINPPDADAGDYKVYLKGESDDSNAEQESGTPAADETAPGPDSGAESS